MERLAIFVNDAPSARRLLPPLLQANPALDCTLVLCPPKLTHRVGKWLSNRQRQNWQRKWAQELQTELEPHLPTRPSRSLDWMVAEGSAHDTSNRLRRQLGVDLKLLDLRKSHLGQNLPELEPGSPVAQDDHWKAPLAVSSSLSVVLALVD